MTQEVVGSNPDTVYWMDASDLLAIKLKKIKVAKWGTPKICLKSEIIDLLIHKNTYAGPLS